MANPPVPFPSSPAGPGEGITRSTSSSHDSRSTPLASNNKPTRTIAILTRACAKVHRLAIEARLTSSGFDILLSRMEEWSYPSDADFLHEFLQGHPTEEIVQKWTERLSNQSIYLMVLERYNCVQTWLDLLGSDGDERQRGEDNDEEEEEEDFDVSFNSFRSSSSSGGIGGAKLRTIYGKHLLYGSISEQQAERQLAICAPELASEEALAELELSMCTDQGDEEEEKEEDVAGSVILREDDVVYNEQGEAFDATTGGQVEIQEEIVENASASASPSKQANKSLNTPAPAPAPAPATFKARPIPQSLNVPRIQPRLSRAAALRMGVPLPAVPKRQQQFATTPAVEVGISGLPKTTVAKPKSLGEPTVKPRANRASLARTGGVGEITSPKIKKEVDFSSTPGHRNKRSSLSAVQLASLKPPTIAPRTNKAAMARCGGGKQQQPPPPPSMHRRSSSIPSSSSGRASPVKNAIAIKQPPPPPLVSSISDTVTATRQRKPVDFSNTPGHKRASMSGASTVAALAAPKIAPRTNLAALRRLSHGGVGGIGGSPQKPTTATATPLLRSRPASSLAFNAKPVVSSAGGGGGGGGHAQKTAVPLQQAPQQRRPSSSAGVHSHAHHQRVHSLPHQDGAENLGKSTRRTNSGAVATNAPPSSYRLPTTAA